MSFLEQKSVKERLVMFLEYKNISQKRFEELAGLSNGYVNNIRVSIKNETFDKKIAPNFPELNKFWLLYGSGDMINKDTEDIKSELEELPRGELQIKEYPTKLAVRLVTNKAQAGWSDGFYADEYLEDLPIVMIDADQEYQGKYLAFEVVGDSMEPDYLAGNIVICREVQRHLWSSKLHYKDWDFVIAHNTQGIMLKEITAHNVEKGIITCHSINPAHKDFKLNLRDITYLFNVVEIRQQGKRKRSNRAKDFYEE